MIPPRLLMCPGHWRRVPRYLQDRVWATYVPGQEARKDPSKAYLDAAEAAIAAVDEQERRAASFLAGQKELFKPTSR